MPFPAPRKIWSSPRAWLTLLLTAGIAFRLLKYFLNFPLFSDEAALALNLMERHYAQLLHSLNYDQVAPVGYLLLEKWCLLHLGVQEWALRLPALIAGLLCFPAFFAAAGQFGGRTARILSLAILASSLYCVNFTVMLKPYSLDLLVACVLLWSGATILRSPARASAAATLLLAPLAVLFSYPSAFIIAAVGIATFPRVWQHGSPASRAVHAFALLLAAATFLTMLLTIGNGQTAASHNTMEFYWHDEFVPLNFTLPWWLLKSHLTGMMSYPFAGKFGVALLIFPLTLLGAVRIWKRNSPAHALLLVLPFLLTLFAAAVHRYPYGGPARVEQHLVPSIFILASHGLASVIALARHSLTRRPRISLCVSILLAAQLLYTLISIALTIRTPYTGIGTEQVRQIARRIFVPTLSPNDPVVIYPHTEVPYVMRYYFQAQPHLPAPLGHLFLNASLAANWLPPTPFTQAWLIALHANPPEVLAPLVAQLQTLHPAEITFHQNSFLPEGPSTRPYDYCEIIHLQTVPAQIDRP